MGQQDSLTRRLLPFLLGMALPLLGEKPAPFTPSTLDLPQVVELSNPSPKGIPAVEHLIALTESNLQAQKELLQLLQKYRTVEQRYLNSPDDEALIPQLIQGAEEIMAVIDSQHLSHLLNEELLSELSLFGRLGSKSNPALQ